MFAGMNYETKITKITTNLSILAQFLALTVFVYALVLVTSCLLQSNLSVAATHKTHPTDGYGCETDG